MTIKLRPYQIETINAVKHDWEKFTDVLAVLATGSGKTIVFLKLLIDLLDSNSKRALVLAHRQELVQQPIERIQQHWPDWYLQSGIVMADNDDCSKRITVATVQTLQSEKRLRQLLAYGPIDYLVTDECFPAGTLVDGTAIEDVRDGDLITAWDEASHQVVMARVMRTMQRPAPDCLVHIHAGGQEIVCTQNHPFLVDGLWISAACLRPGYYLTEVSGNGNQTKAMCCVRKDLPAAQLEYTHGPDLLGRVQKETPRGAGEGSGPCVYRVRQTGGVSWTSRPDDGPQQSGLLLDGVQDSLPTESIGRMHGTDQPEICFGTDEAQQPDGQSGEQGKDDSNPKGHRPQTTSTGRERPGPDGSTANVGRCLGLADGSGHPDGTLSGWIGNTDQLQSRCGESGPEDSGRSGWQVTPSAMPEVRGCEERGVPHRVRVDRVEILESAGDRTFGGLCPGGVVYNLEVGEYHTYTAYGFVVHNCHHSVSDSYVNILDMLKDVNPDMRHLGVTATPMRADGAGLAQVFQKESAHYGIRELVKAGYLAPPRWLAIQTGISLKGITSYKGDYSAKRLADVYDTANCFDLVVETHTQYADGRQCLAFTASVAGAYGLAETFNAAGIPAEAADATTDRHERHEILRDFRNGKIQILCNMGLFTEGLDVPQVSCIHQVRPTKSDALYTQMIGRALRIVPGKLDALVLDYAPIESRNVVMMGDVLGVDARKDVYVKETEEIGEVVAGMTFDGDVKWLSGDPMEIISRQLDYLNLSPFSWHKAVDGWMSIGLGKASDDVERSLLMSPPGEEMALYLVAKRPTDRRAKAYLVKGGDFADLSDWAEQYIEERGQAVLAQKAKRWRNEPATENQIRFARRLGIREFPSKGVVAETITHILALQAMEGIA